MFRVASFAITFVLVSFVIDAQAQQCQTRPLALEVNQDGYLDTTDCTFVPPWCSPDRGSAITATDPCYDITPGEYWTVTASAGEMIAVTAYLGTAAAGIYRIDDESGAPVGAYQYLDPYCRCNRQWFRAVVDGTYRVFVRGPANAYSSRYGSYTIRAQRVTLPLPGELVVTGEGNDPYTTTTISWRAFLSPTPVLEYVLEIGSRPGASDLGMFPMGTATHAVFSAIPAGTYYVRVRGRSASGWSDPTAERSVTGRATASTNAPYLTGRIDHRRVLLAWSPPPSGTVLYYELLVSLLSGEWNWSPEYGQTVYNIGSLPWLDVPNVPRGRYFVRVRAVTTAGRSEQSNELGLVIFDP